MQIYIFDIAKCNKKRLLSVYDTSPDYRKEKFRLAKQSGDKLRILAGSFLLSYIAQKHSLSEHQISLSHLGKPYFKGANIFISLSHSKDICTAAVSDSPIGIDVEKNVKHNLTLATRFFSEKEQRILNGAFDKNLAFTEIWTKKEALFKASSPEDYTLRDLCTTERFAMWNNRSFELMTFSENGYIFSVCKEGEIKKTEKFYPCL